MVLQFVHLALSLGFGVGLGRHILVLGGSAKDVIASTSSMVKQESPAVVLQLKSEFMVEQLDKNIALLTKTIYFINCLP